jgi:hypothetical protein
MMKVRFSREFGVSWGGIVTSCFLQPGRSSRQVRAEAADADEFVDGVFERDGARAGERDRLRGG